MTGIYGVDPYQQLNTSFQISKIKSESEQAQHMRELIRNLKQTPVQNDNPFAVTSSDRTNGFLDLTESQKEDEKDSVDLPYNYNCKEVETKIQRAKTSVSAGQAVISARRKVLEVKRQMASGKGDADELQLALTHAKRMEMVARKKKHHLELEEMAETLQKRNENAKENEDASDNIKDAERSVIEAKAEETFDKIFEMVKKLSDEELKELQDSLEMIEDMEVIDSHMSKEDLDELKRKHRLSEQKAMLKADMDYMKCMAKLGSTGNTMLSLPGVSTPTMAANAAQPMGGIAIDVQV